MVGDAVLGEVIRADALAAVDGADLAGPVGRCVGLRLLFGQRLQPGREHLHRARLVLQLGALVLARHDDAGGQVRDAHRRVGGVHALAALARRPVDVDAEVGLVDLDLLDLFGFGINQHAGRRGVHPALGFGDGNPLNPVHAALELQSRPHTVGGVALAGDGQRRILVAAEVGGGLPQHRDGPAVPFGVPDVHASQVGGEQRRLFAALAGLHLEHDVVGVVGVAGGEQIRQLGVELGDLGGQLGHLVGERRVVGGEFLGGLEITSGRFELAVGGHDRRDLREAPAHLAGGGGVRVQFGIGQPLFQLAVLGENRLDRRCSVGHLDSSSTCRNSTQKARNGARSAHEVRQSGRRCDSYLLRLP